MRKLNSFFEVNLVLGLGFLLILAGCGTMGAKKHWCKVDTHLLDSLLVSGSNQQPVKPFRVSFYNLENLFDTVDGPNDDAEFLPNSANAWNGERYKSKLRNMAQVIDSIAPDILGLVELENAFVLEDLRANSVVMKGRFEIAHRESPDLRGIDVALMYNAELFRISGIYMIPITLPDGYATRSIMRVHLVEKGTGDSLAVFINHWPSRRGGAASAASRMAAAAALLHNIQSTYNLPNNYILLGDFNDDPEDKSITEGLNAGDSYHPIVNLAFVARAKDTTVGTIAWFDGWNMFDQIMLSRALYFNNLHNNETLANKQITFAEPRINVYKRPWMLQHGGKYDGWPLRTFAGKKYMNGFSDHLPVYTDLVLVHRH